jgi:hypothetical protein
MENDVDTHGGNMYKILVVKTNEKEQMLDQARKEYRRCVLYFCFVLPD